MARSAKEGAKAASIGQVALSSLIGTIVEWYDFFLYATTASLVFNTQFFPTDDPRVGTIAAFGSFAAGFVTRPLGGVIFGHFGDRLGRRGMLVITMMIMGLATFIMGVVPTYAQAGLAAPIILLLLRMLQGIGLGGEWGGAALMTVEHSPRRRRGWFGSWPQLGVPIGLLLANGAVSVTMWLVGEDGFKDWAWRIPFLISIGLVGVGLFIRFRIDESPSFQKITESETQVKLPLGDVVRRHPRALLLGMGARFSESLTFNIYNAFLIAYVTMEFAVPDQLPINGLLIAAVVGIPVILLGGRLSDRIGRRPVFGAGAILATVTAFPVFWMIDTQVTSWIWIGTVIGWGLAACLMYGPESALFAEIFPARVRYSGMSAVYQIGVLPSGAIAPAVGSALVLWSGGQSWPVAAYVAVIGIISAVSVYFLRETAFTDTDELDDHPTTGEPTSTDTHEPAR